MDALIAIPYSGGEVFRHFGKASSFKIYTVKDSAVVSSEVLETGGESHEDLALWLVWHGVNAVVCGNAGPGMQGALAAAGIAMHPGAEGDADEAMAKFLAGELPAAGAGCPGRAGGCGGHCGHCGH